MKRTNLNLVVDVAAFGGFVFLATTGVLMRYILPAGSGRYSTIWGLDRHEWGGIHFWISVIFFSLLVIHLILHWRWVASVVTGKPREGSGFRVGLGSVGLFALITLSISPLITPIEKHTNSPGDSVPAIHKYEETSIRGSMSLSEIEKTTGVPARIIIEALKLPEAVSAEGRLGQLKREYGFELDDVREIIREYKR